LAADWELTLPENDGNSGQFLKTDGSGNTSWDTPAGAGDIVGPATSTDNAIPRFHSTTGKIIQEGYDSGKTPTISDAGVLTLPGGIDGKADGNAVAAGKVGETFFKTTSEVTAAYGTADAIKVIAQQELSAGVWSISAFAPCQNVTRPSAGYGWVTVDIYDSSTSTVLHYASGGYWRVADDATQDSAWNFLHVETPTLSFSGANRTIQFRLIAGTASGTPTNYTVNAYVGGFLKFTRTA
jgi:hypothetical protein